MKTPVASMLANAAANSQWRDALADAEARDRAGSAHASFALVTTA